MHKSLDNLRLDEILAFVAVAESGSFTRAAERLGRHASVLSRRISGIEERLGVKLVNRTTRRNSLTEAGLTYLERVRAILGALEEADAEAASASHVAKGVLRVSAPVDFGRLWVAPLIPDFLTGSPAVEIDLRLSNRYVDLVADRFDLAVRLGVLRDSSIVSRKVASHQRLLCASPAYLASRGTPTHPSELRTHACLGSSHVAGHPNWSFQENQSRVSVSISGPLAADDTSALLPAAIAGWGIVTCVDWLVGPDLAAGRLVRVLPEWSLEGEGAIYVVTASAPFLPRKTRAFIDWFAARMGPVPPWAQLMPSTPDIVPPRQVGSRGTLVGAAGFEPTTPSPPD